MDRFFHPASIAVVGANKDRGGGQIVRNLRNGFAGGIYPVNPKYKEIQGIACFPDLEAIPHDVEISPPTGVSFVNLHNKTGLVVPSRNASSLAHAIQRLLASPELRKSYGQNGQERVQMAFTKEKMGEAVLKVYEAVL